MMDRCIYMCTCTRNDRIVHFNICTLIVYDKLARHMNCMCDRLTLFFLTGHLGPRGSILRLHASQLCLQLSHLHLTHVLQSHRFLHTNRMTIAQWEDAMKCAFWTRTIAEVMGVTCVWHFLRPADAVKWTLYITGTLGWIMLSSTERLSSFRGNSDIGWCIGLYTWKYMCITH